MEIRARRRTLKLTEKTLQTPRTVPSYSSRVRPPDQLHEFLDQTLARIDALVLLSAYDVHHRPGKGTAELFAKIDEARPFAVMLDSGGYELIWNEKATRAGIIPKGRAPDWSDEAYFGLLDAWGSSVPLLAVTYDYANELRPMPDQIAAARRMAARYPRASIDFLIKPSASTDRPASAPLKAADITPFVGDLEDFPVIGVTEKEIGGSMRDRVHFIAALRDALDEAGLEVPIHVFGGLDPWMTPLYFMAGADVFDGLSWLRYAWADGESRYEQGFVAITNPLGDIESAVWDQRRANIGELIRLEEAMNDLADHANVEKAFGTNGERIRRAWDTIWRSE